MNFIDQKAGLPRARLIDILRHNSIPIGSDLKTRDNLNLRNGEDKTRISQFVNQYESDDNSRFVLTEVILEYESYYQPGPGKLFLAKIFLLDKQEGTAKRIWQFESCSDNQILQCPLILKMELQVEDGLPTKAKFLLVDRSYDLRNEPLLMKVQDETRKTNENIADIMKMVKYKSFRKLKVHTEDLTQLY